MTGSRLLSIGTAAPDACISPDDGQRVALALTPEMGEDQIRALYQSCGVHSRSAVLTPDQLIAEHADRHRGATTAQRLSRFLPGACDLAERAARTALHAAELRPGDVRHLVTVSCTGASAPGVDHALIERLELPDDVTRTNIGFMGCHGAINGLRTADALARTEPAGVALVVCVELCSLHYQTGAIDHGQAVANAIFADGAGAAVIAPDTDTTNTLGRPIRGFGSTRFPGTAELMSWNITDHGFAMHLSARVPAALRRSIADWVDAWTRSLGCGHLDDFGWAIHPGGPDILTAAARGLGLAPGALEYSEQVLREHGNMSSGTVLWVLDRVLRSDHAGPIAALAFGPGLCGEGMLLG